MSWMDDNMRSKFGVVGVDDNMRNKHNIYAANRPFGLTRTA